MKIIFLMIFLFLCSPVVAEETSEEVQSNYILCRNRKIVRTVRVEVNQDNTCKTTYTKAGIDRIIGTGNFRTSCYRFLNNVRANLKTAGWKCKDISSTQITASADADE